MRPPRPSRALAAVTFALFACATIPRAERIARLEHGLAEQLVAVRAGGKLCEELDLSDGGPKPAADGATSYYEPTVVRFEPLRRGHEAGLREQIATTLEKRGASAFLYQGEQGAREFAPPWQRQPFDGVPPAVMYAVVAAGKTEFRGAELDLRVPVQGGGAEWVTVWNELDERVTARSEVTSLPQVSSAVVDGAALSSRFGIGAVDGWSSRELESLEEALELLAPAEVAALAGLPFRRASRSGRLLVADPQGKHCGHYGWEGHLRHIEIFDCAFEFDGDAFVGDPAQPRRPSVRVILHEIGHAISMAQLSEVLRQLAPAWREMAGLVDEFNRLARSIGAEEVERFEAIHRDLREVGAILEGARRALEPTRSASFDTSVLRAFMAVPGANSGFTPYGRTSSRESFAEAFSLFRADPEACRRISPEVFAFFASGAHVARGSSS